MLQVVALAFALAINNFFGAVSLGTADLTRRERALVVALFATADCGLPVVGILLGVGLARALGPVAAYLGAALIMLTAVYIAVQREPARGPGNLQAWPLVLTALALGMDNLAAAIGLGAMGVSLPGALIAFAAVTGALTLTGLTLGQVLGRSLAGRRVNGLAGALLFVTGAAMAAARLWG